MLLRVKGDMQTATNRMQNSLIVSGLMGVVCLVASVLSIVHAAHGMDLGRLTGLVQGSAIATAVLTLLFARLVVYYARNWQENKAALDRTLAPPCANPSFSDEPPLYFQHEGDDIYVVKDGKWEEFIQNPQFLGKLLLDRSVNAEGWVRNSATGERYSLIEIAIRYGSPELVGLLLPRASGRHLHTLTGKACIRFSGRSEKGYGSPFEWAMANPHNPEAIIRCLLDHGFKERYLTPMDLIHIVRFASAITALRVVRDIDGIRLKGMQHEGHSLLYWAAKRADPLVYDALRDKGLLFSESEELEGEYLALMQRASYRQARLSAMKEPLPEPKPPTPARNIEAPTRTPAQPYRTAFHDREALAQKFGTACTRDEEELAKFGESVIPDYFKYSHPLHNCVEGDRWNEFIQNPQFLGSLRIWERNFAECWVRNSATREQFSLLEIAIRYGSPELAHTFILEASDRTLYTLIEPDQVHTSRRSRAEYGNPFEWALANPHHPNAVISLLLEREGMAKAYLSTKDLVAIVRTASSETALKALRQFDIPTLKELLWEGHSLLHWADQREDREVYDALIECGFI